MWIGTINTRTVHVLLGEFMTELWNSIKLGNATVAVEKTLTQVTGMFDTLCFCVSICGSVLILVRVPVMVGALSESIGSRGTGVSFIFDALSSQFVL